MESHFQTSFIPKKSVGPQLMPQPGSRRHTANLFSTLSTILFLLALAAGVGLFIWDLVLSRRVVSLTEKIAEARASFEPDVIERLRRIDTRINTAKQVLARHTDPSPLFDVLEAETLRNVAFRQLTYTTKSANVAEIMMSGEALGFATLALQGDLFSKNQGLQNPVFAHFGETERGRVTFDFTATLNPALIAYRALEVPGLPIESTPTNTGTSTDDTIDGGQSTTSNP